MKVLSDGPYIGYKMYGPYESKKDGRLRCVLVDEGNTKITISYPKLLIELHYGFKLLGNETVDHIDGDFTNNDLSNLQILDRSVHITKDSIKYISEDFVCPICSKHFSLKYGKLRERKGNERRGIAGPFCSRKCSGIYGTEVQRNRRHP